MLPPRVPPIIPSKRKGARMKLSVAPTNLIISMESRLAKMVRFTVLEITNTEAAPITKVTNTATTERI